MVRHGNRPSIDQRGRIALFDNVRVDYRAPDALFFDAIHFVTHGHQISLSGLSYDSYASEPTQVYAAQTCNTIEPNQVLQFDDFSVTVIDTFYCYGSVGFLFVDPTKNQRVLYLGNFNYIPEYHDMFFDPLPDLIYIYPNTLSFVPLSNSLIFKSHEEVMMLAFLQEVEQCSMYIHLQIEYPFPLGYERIFEYLYLYGFRTYVNVFMYHWTSIKCCLPPLKHLMLSEIFEEFNYKHCRFHLDKVDNLEYKTITIGSREKEDAIPFNIDYSNYQKVKVMNDAYANGSNIMMIS